MGVKLGGQVCEFKDVIVKVGEVEDIPVYKVNDYVFGEELLGTGKLVPVEYETEYVRVQGMRMARTVRRLPPGTKLIVVVNDREYAATELDLGDIEELYKAYREERERQLQWWQEHKRQLEKEREEKRRFYEALGNEPKEVVVQGHRSLAFRSFEAVKQWLQRFFEERGFRVGSIEFGLFGNIKVKLELPEFIFPVEIYTKNGRKRAFRLVRIHFVGVERLRDVYIPALKKREDGLYIAICRAAPENLRMRGFQYLAVELVPAKYMKVREGTREQSLLWLMRTILGYPVTYILRWDRVHGDMGGFPWVLVYPESREVCVEEVNRALSEAADLLSLPSWFLWWDEKADREVRMGVEVAEELVGERL